MSSSPVEDIFLSALEKATPQERGAFLSEVCRDLDVRRQVERLLEAHPKAEGFLEHAPAMTQVAEFRPQRDAEQDRTSDMVGTVVAGRYKLVEEIAEGGMGTVWVAEQTEPVRRRVALKLIKPGMDSRQEARCACDTRAIAVGP
jgi:hypothetical protein